MEFSTKKSVWISIIILFIILSLLVVLLFYFSDLFIVFIIGGVIILITERGHKKFRKMILGLKLHENKLLKIGFTVITILFWLILLYLLTSFTVKDINKTVTFMQENNVTVEQIYVEKGEAILGKEMVGLIQTENIFNSIKNFITKSLLNIVSGVAVFIAEAIIIIPLMFAFYFKNKNILKEKISKMMPKRFRKGFVNIITNSSEKLKSYTYAKLVESFIIASISSSLIFFHFIFFLIASTAIFDLLVNSIFTKSLFFNFILLKTSSKIHTSPCFTRFLEISKFTTSFSLPFDSSTLSKTFNKYFFVYRGKDKLMGF
jgi:predicted PurR-regulated permease PerM